MAGSIQYRNSDLARFLNETVSLLVRYDVDDKIFSLVIKRELVADDIIVYSAGTRKIIYDFQVVDNADNLKVIWREKENILFGASQSHYAEIDENFQLINHQVIPQSEESSERFVCLRGIVLSDYLLTVWIDTVVKHVVLNTYSVDDLSRLVASTTLDDSVSEAYQYSYQSFIANVTLEADSNGTVYLQNLLESSTLRTYSVTVDMTQQSVTVDKLFDFGYEDIGFHRCLIDDEQKLMIVVYSGQSLPDELNNIYVATQKIFSESRSISVAAVQKVNQSPGMFYRPSVVKHGDDYIIAWEGDELYYSGVNDSLDITISENIVSVQEPGNILLDIELNLSCQNETLQSKDRGEGFVMTKINVN